jgi:hypothetical protein
MEGPPGANEDARPPEAGPPPAEPAKEPAEHTGPAPDIEVPETSHDFGTIREDGKARHSFAVFNKGDATLEIKAVRHG